MVSREDSFHCEGRRWMWILRTFLQGCTRSDGNQSSYTGITGGKYAGREFDGVAMDPDRQGRNPEKEKTGQDNEKEEAEDDDGE